MKFNPFTRRYSVSKAELGRLLADAGATTPEALSEKLKRDYSRDAFLEVKEITRWLDEAALLVRRQGPTDIEVRLQGIGRFR